MPWAETTRRHYERKNERYPSGTTDEDRALLKRRDNGSLIVPVIWAPRFLTCFVFFLCCGLRGG